jgi:hypothetical protein
VRGAEQQRKKGFVGAAVGKYEASDALRVLGDQDLADGPSRVVVPDQGHVAHSAPLYKMRNHAGHPTGRKVGVLLHWYRMPA